MSGKLLYCSPTVNLVKLDAVMPVLMTSGIGNTNPNDSMDQLPGWPESGWTQKLFKIIFR